MPGRQSLKNLLCLILFGGRFFQRSFRRGFRGRFLGFLGGRGIVVGVLLCLLGAEGFQLGQEGLGIRLLFLIELAAADHFVGHEQTDGKDDAHQQAGSGLEEHGNAACTGNI